VPIQPPTLTDEQIRDSFLVGGHTARKGPGLGLETNYFSVVDPALIAAWRKRALEERPLSPKWYMIMTMQMRGMTNVEIAKKLGMYANSIGTIQKTEKYRKAFEQRITGLDQEILALKPKAVDALSNALDDKNRDTALRAARTYFEMTGQGTFGKTAGEVQGGVSAVGLARALLAESRATAVVHNTIYVGQSGEASSNGEVASRAEAPQHLRGVHEEPPRRLLTGPPGELGSLAPTGAEGGRQPHRVEADSPGAAQEQYELPSLDHRHTDSDAT